MDYGEAFTKAFRLSWRNRYLWFFGFFVGGGFGFPGGSFNVSGDFGDGHRPRFRAVSPEISSIDLDLIILVAAIALVVLIVFIFLSLLSQGGLTEAVAALDRGEARSFGATFGAGWSNTWRVFKVCLLAFVIALAGLIALGIPVAAIILATFAITQSVAARVIVAIVVGGLAILALIVFLVALGIVQQVALRHVVLVGGRAVDALKAGYGLFRAKLGPVLLVWLIALGIAVGGAIALLLAGLLVGLILALPAIILAISHATTAAFIAGGVALIIFLPLLLAAAGALGTYRNSFWTLSYLRLTAPPPAPAVAEAPVPA
jgi:hypothetical protein